MYARKHTWISTGVVVDAFIAIALSPYAVHLVFNYIESGYNPSYDIVPEEIDNGEQEGLARITTCNTYHIRARVKSYSKCDSKFEGNETSLLIVLSATYCLRVRGRGRCSVVAASATDSIARFQS